MAEYLAMGGYAWFVWPSYGFAALLLCAMLGLSLRRLRRAERRLAEAETNRPRRARAGPPAGALHDA